MLAEVEELFASLEEGSLMCTAKLTNTMVQNGATDGHSQIL